MTSATELRFEDLKRLRDREGRAQLGHFLAEGEHLVLELGRALAHRSALAASRILVSHEYLERGLPAGFPTQLPRDTFNARQMAPLSDTRSPQGVIAVVPILPAPPPVVGERAVYLHEVQDPGNLGTILRTLAWFGGFRCLLSPDSVDPYNPKAVRASMGAVFTLPFESDVTLDDLRQRYRAISLLDKDGRDIADHRLAGGQLVDGGLAAADCLMFGNEARGASPEMKAIAAGAVFSIPGAATGRGVESLNLATAVAVCAYGLSRSAPLGSPGLR
jgi:TrmH family RNA methyltransferase